MNTNKKLLFVLLSIVLMTGSGLLLSLTINRLYDTSSAWATLPLSLVSVFLYMAGVSLISRSAGSGSRGADNAVVSAFLLIAAGTLLLCFNTGLLDPAWEKFFFSWPMLLFAAGALAICRFHFIWGILFAAAGKFFLVEKAAAIYPDELLYEQFTSTYWPVLIIFSGIFILLCAILHPRKKRSVRNRAGFCTPGENASSDGKINYQFVFSGTEQVILDPVFKGGNIETTFGGIDLDLRRTSLAEGETVLYLNAVFGGIAIAAPDNWEIEIRSRSIAGGITDSRAKNVEKDRTRKLVIVARCTFGGIEIK